jgi:hypothetical protein
MAKRKIRANLSEATRNELHDLYLKLSVPAMIPRLRDGVLTRQEIRSLDGTERAPSASLKNWIPFRKVLQTVAAQRHVTLERAVLELAKGLDFLRTGRYEILRKAIGEPVAAPRDDIPIWDPFIGELLFKGKVVRRLPPRAWNCRRILDAFQEDGWMGRIDSPFPSAKNSRALREGVRTLNNSLLRIKFYCDGTGEGVQWQQEP